MIGIYKKSFLDYLRKYLGDPVKVKSSNIVCRCPWCEIGTEKKHYHLNISLEAPIFHCFYSGCNQSGTVSKLQQKISGNKSKNFVDESKITRVHSNKIPVSSTKTIKLPDLNEKKFYEKSLYVKYRLKFYGSYLNNIPNLVFDIRKFFQINPHLKIDSKSKNLLDFYHANFIGFLSHNQTVLLLRNIKHGTSFRYSKIKLSTCEFIDYYKITKNPTSDTVVLAEGPFDILVESIFDTLNLRSNVSMYTACMSTLYEQLVKSIAFHENMFNPDVIILSDSNVSEKYYKNLQQKIKHMIKTIKVFYNTKGKDFGEYSVPERII